MPVTISICHYRIKIKSNMPTTELTHISS